YEDTMAGKVCKEDSSLQTLHCEYKVGKSLVFSIDGIGTPNTGVAFVKSDYDGDYYATFGVGHGCVVIKHGKASPQAKASPMFLLDFAFVSPQTGKVYKDWGSCKSGR
ncbi:MAG: hypothetical protein Q7R45_01695, partial [Sulfuricaulis sp.]|nr:hypothetical protein [Sulfuricaulis sp.]